MVFTIGNQTVGSFVIFDCPYMIDEVSVKLLDDCYSNTSYLGNLNLHHVINTLAILFLYDFNK